jgi:hypothetical protein
LHAATRAGALDPAGGEALLRYVLRPPIAQERVELRPDGLVRIALKKAYTDGTVAVDMDPLSLLLPAGHQRPPSAVPHRERRGPARIGEPVEIAPRADAAPDATAAIEPETAKGAGGYRGWAELLARTFALDVLACPQCQGRMKLIVMVTDPASIARYLAAVGEATEAPRRTPSRGPPYWKSRVLRPRARRRGRLRELRWRGRRGAVGAGGVAAACSGSRMVHGIGARNAPAPERRDVRGRDRLAKRRLPVPLGPRRRRVDARTELV